MLLPEALNIIHSLAEASKMPCFTYSLSALKCKRGGLLQKVPGSVCHKCYALRGNFIRPKVQAVMLAREQAMRHPQWAEAMVIVLKAKEHSGYFRWYSSGDLRSLKDLVNICKVAEGTPKIRHWLPTKEINILAQFKKAGLKFPKNLLIRLSADMLEAKPSRNIMKNLGVLGSAVSKTNYNCPASSQDNECCECRLCWQKRTAIVTYKYH